MSSVRILVSYRGRLVTVQWRDWATPWRGDQMSHSEGQVDILRLHKCPEKDTKCHFSILAKDTQLNLIVNKY